MERAITIRFGRIADTGELVEITPELGQSFFDLSSLRASCRTTPGYVVCVVCSAPLAVHSKAIHDGSDQHLYHFQHMAGTGEGCPLKSPENHPDKSALREGAEHLHTKASLSAALARLPDWEVVDVDSRFVFSADRSQRAKPDIHARYRGQDLAIEIQLRSEQIEVIHRRSGHYRELGWPLLWVSITPDEILPEGKDSTIKIKQVQKDIAYINKGNFFLVDAELLASSVAGGELLLRCRYLAAIRGGERACWVDETVAMSALTLEPGAAWFVDSKSQIEAVDSEYRAAIRVEIRRLAEYMIQPDTRRRYTDRESFVLALESALTEVTAAPADVLMDAKHHATEQFIRIREPEILEFKRRIISLFVRMNNAPEKNAAANALRVWNGWAEKALDGGGDIGLRPLTDLRVVQSLLLIMGYRISDHLSPEKNRHVNSLHFFLDARPADAAITLSGAYDLPYGCGQQAAVYAAMHGKAGLHIFEDKTITPARREIIENPTASPRFLMRFVAWMLSAPVYNQ